MMSALGERIDVVVCVHNAVASVRRCLRSLELYLPANARLVVVDDGSDEATRGVMAEFQARIRRMDLLRNEYPLGYTRAANRGLRASDAEIAILLNSDTIVSDGWADRIAEVFRSDQQIGIVGPLSNAASWQSFPRTRAEDGAWIANDLPLAVELDELAELVARTSRRDYPRLPAINGFCFAIHRRVIDAIGLLDEETFPVGYGEETDYCMRASEAGFSLAVADHAFVYHEKSSSFGHERRAALSRSGWEALKGKHGAAALAQLMERSGREQLLPERRSAIQGAVQELQQRKLANGCRSPAAMPASSKDLGEFLDRQRSLIAIPRRTQGEARVFVLVSPVDSIDRVHLTLRSIAALGPMVRATVVGPDQRLRELVGVSASTCASSGDAPVPELATLLETCSEHAVAFVAAGDVVHRTSLVALDALHDANAGCIACTFDEDTVGPDGARTDPALKPAFSPTLLAESAYVGMAAWIRRESAQQIGLSPAFPTQFVSALLLSAWQQGAGITHSPVIGTSRGASLFHCPTAAERAGLRDLLVPGVSQPTRDSLRASIIVPFRDRPELLRCCANTLLGLTAPADFELLLVDNASNDAETEELLCDLERDERVRVLRDPRAFNYSSINNLAAACAKGRILVFLNNDTEILHPEWLAELCTLAEQERTGAVGALLFYPDGSIQHAGVVIGFRGLAGHLFSGAFEHDVPSIWVRYRRETSAVTGACMAVSRSRFQEVGGFDERFEVTASDVELCLRLAKRGYRNVFTPHARLVHHEKKTRSPMPVRAADIELSLTHYEPFLSEGDPYLNRWIGRTGPGLALSTTSEIDTRRFAREAKGRLDALRREQHARSERIRSLAGELKERRRLPGDAEVTVYDAGTADLAANASLLWQAPAHNPLRSITWFVPYFDLILRGGIFTIFRIADHLSRTLGSEHNIVVYGASRRVASAIDAEIRTAFPQLRFKLLMVPSMAEVDSVPAADAGVCTLWNSAYYLLRYNRCRAKFYLVQDYEPAFQAAGSVAGLIEQTYRFGFTGIANTPGVADMYRRYGSPATSFVPAVARETFWPVPDPELAFRDRIKVVFYGRPNNARNGFRLGIEGLRLAKLALGDAIDVVSVGGEFDPAEYGAAGLIESRGVLRSIDEVAGMYRSADIGLVFMFTAHPSYQPFEYMASGCAVISNYNEHNLWFLRQRENSLLCAPTASAVAESVVELVQDSSLRQRLRDEGLRSIGQLDWERSMAAVARFMQLQAGDR